MSTVKVVKIVKRPRKSKLKINKISSKTIKGGSCGLDHKQKRGGCNMGCPCKCGCPYCSKMMKGGQICAGERLHGCLRREIKQNNIRAEPKNGSNKDFTLHSKYPRFTQNEKNVTRDLVKTNKRSDVSVERIANGKMTGGKKYMKKNKKGGSMKKIKKTIKKTVKKIKKSLKKLVGGKKGEYTKPSLKRVSAATPEYAKKHAKLAKGGASGYKKSKNRPARINNKSTKPRKPVKNNSKFA